MRGLSRVLASVLAGLFWFSAAMAEGSGWGPDFSGQWVISSPKKPDKKLKAKFYASRGRTAMEREIPKRGRKKYGKRVVDITDPYQRVQVRLYPDVRKYMQRSLKIKEAIEPPPLPGEEGHPCSMVKKMTCTPLGSETLEGRRTRKWEFVVERKGKESRMIQWIDPQLRIAIKEVIPGKMERRLTGIRTGRLPDTLFRVPSGYEKIKPKKRKKRKKKSDSEE